MAEKQDLNEAYYGPSVPPPTTRSYHWPGRGDSGGCLGCYSGLICKLIYTIIIIIIGIAVYLFLPILHPNQVKVHVTDASLTQFYYANNTLHYNLVFHVIIHNPNGRLGIYHDSIEVGALYQGTRLDSENLPPFYQGHKTTNYLSHTFQGKQGLMLDSDQTSEYNKEKGRGVYNIGVYMYRTIRYKLGVFKTGKHKPKVKCELKVPLTINGTTSSAAFEPIECN